MTPHDFILVVLVVALMILLAHYGRARLDKAHHACRVGPESDYSPPRRCARIPAPTPAGAPTDARILYRPPPSGSRPHEILYEQEASRTPKRIAEAERELWYTSEEAGRPGAFDSELARDNGTDCLQYHSERPAIDYSSYITNSIIDPDALKKHASWVAEMGPWSGTATTVDNLDEALEASISFHGLRRGQAVAQSNPLQVTEIDASHLAGNPKFNFRG